ncbi:MAG TPA: type II secretion system protein [Candidatus Omnitrophota bacterium]|nr:type II secretion system protein [Candidatus Omnitrophota bacterium]HPD85309.1 type II secretion system protein [Candidatus Omnitrophota bacterium]HRZ04190.1 type II secretion system protein [Candidatus Omnitrophota bacterium]
MLSLKKKNGFSLVEVIIASVIFIISTVGLFSALSGLRTASGESKKRLFAANYGKQVLEGLRAKVDDRTWNDSCNPGTMDLSVTLPNPCTHGPFTTTVDGTTYTVQYTVTPQMNPSVPTQEMGRTINMTVTWPL